MNRKNNKKVKTVSNIILGVILLLGILTAIGVNMSDDKNISNNVTRKSTSSSYTSNNNSTSKSYSSSTNTKSYSTCKFSESQCKAYAKYCVKNKLKSPSSAKFGALTMTEFNGEILIAGTVEAKNSFGTMIQSSFIVTLSADGNTCKSVDIW